MTREIWDFVHEILKAKGLENEYVLVWLKGADRARGPWAQEAADLRSKALQVSNLVNLLDRSSNKATFKKAEKACDELEKSIKKLRKTVFLSDEDLQRRMGS